MKIAAALFYNTSRERLDTQFKDFIHENLVGMRISSSSTSQWRHIAPIKFHNSDVTADSYAIAV